VTDPAPYEDRLAAALRLSGIIAGPTQVDALTEAIRQIVADELASLGGHLLGVYGAGPDPATLTSAADPAAEAQAAALGTLGGFLLQHYGQGG
jgi:hypothetical protein